MDNETAVRIGLYVFGLLEHSEELIEMAQNSDIQDAAQEFMGWWWDVTNNERAFREEFAPDYDEETLEAITNLVTLLQRIAYPDHASHEDTALYESPEQMPWNRNGSEDAAALWEVASGHRWADDDDDPANHYNYHTDPID